MSDLSSGAPAATTKKRSWDWSAIAGLAFVPLFVFGFGTSAPGTPEPDADISEWADWVTDSANGNAALLSAFLTVLAAITLVLFVTGLARRISDNQGPDGRVSAYVYGLGLTAAGLLATATVALNTGPIQYLFDDELVDPIEATLFLQFQSLGYGLAFVGTGLMAAAMIALASAGLRGAMPGWFTVVGYVVAALLVLSVMWVPFFLLPLWVLIASILMLRSPSTT